MKKEKIIEKIKICGWTALNYPKLKFKIRKYRKEREALHILTSSQTIDYILEYQCSISRFGDGELRIMSHYLSGGSLENALFENFQLWDPLLAKRLNEVFVTQRPNLLVCVPYPLIDSSIHNVYTGLFWDREFLMRYSDMKKLGLRELYGDTNMTRFYMNRRDIKDYPVYIGKLKSLWNKRSLLIVEGDNVRLGIGNDLFDNSASIRRILCPTREAFSKYDEILSTVKKEASKKDLILIALGPTATIMAYDLSNLGYQTFDIGHIDIEYEWWRMKAKTKVAVPHKFVYEAHNEIIREDFTDQTYLSQIIATIQT
jgi:glycosyltransferase family protein